MPRRRSSAGITLVLIGSASLSACNHSSTEQSRDVYANRADCVRDWGDDERKCERAGSGNAFSGFYLGPLYGAAMGRAGASGHVLSEPREGSHAIGSANVTRGGFGSSAGMHGSSGG